MDDAHSKLEASHEPIHDLVSRPSAVEVSWALAQNLGPWICGQTKFDHISTAQRQQRINEKNSRSFTQKT